MHQHRRILFALIIACSCFAKAQDTFTVMSYNIENAFDTIHDEGKNDQEFCAGGERGWNRYRLFEKLRGVSKVIAAADEQRPIDLIGLCEVENDTVMKYLTRYTPLRHIGYQHIITESNDERGIDVALLYSPFTFHPIETQKIRVSTKNESTRDVLHVTGTLNNGDTLDIYVLHLPSRRGGGKAHSLSKKVVQALCSNIDSIRLARQQPNLIVMGDFNAEKNTPQLKSLTQKGILTNQTAKLKPGTYKYQGAWSTIDHILTYTTSLTPQHSQILNLPFLIEPDPTNGGDKPRRTYLGPIYQGGISDHLPIVTRFVFP